MSARAPGRIHGASEGGNARRAQTIAGFRQRAEGDGYVRERYVGQPRRGQPGPFVVDRIDVRLAIDELTAAFRMLTEAEGMEPGPARRELHKAAVSKVALASRACDDLVIRRGGELT